MSEARLLSLVLRYPHPAALARHSCGLPLFQALRRLESSGLVRRLRGEYRLTRRGRAELEFAHAVDRLVARSRS